MVQPLHTDKLSQFIRITGLWPPPPAMAREMLAIVPRSLLLQVYPEWDQVLNQEDWYIDKGSPSLILGTAQIRADNGYYARELYSPQEALRWTALFRGPQREAEARETAKAKRDQDRQRLEKDRKDRWLAASEADRLEAERKAREKAVDPQQQRFRDMEQRLAELEAKQREPIIGG